MDDFLNSSGESQSPISKASRLREGNDPQCNTSVAHLPHTIRPLQTSSSFPTFAPWGSYMKLMLEGNPSVDVKLRWLAEVIRALKLERTLAEIKMAVVTSHFVYIARNRPNIDGQPISRIVITWNLQEPPPSSIDLSFLPCLPSCEVREVSYKCWGIGHISRYCSAPEKCALCAGSHDSRTCPHRAPPLPPTATRTLPPPADVTAHWKCLRCQAIGVSVWHGCSRPKAASTLPLKQPLPPPIPIRTDTTDISILVSPFPEVQALRNTADKLMTRCASLETRLDTIEACMSSMVAIQAKTEATLATLVEMQQASISSVNSLMKRLETFVRDDLPVV
ncbi:hypothetical protein E2C01_053910 [Portunus trituberculatus]|uniref:Uncharacterized protein n=1 Tax=Portunus trituberculatus TaxID=210409 RepID=A0A5B7GIG4_PORTR|nr:hypothetical protein [Portunus trituberculatus]